MSYIDIESFTSGFKPGGIVFAAGRQTGKSLYYSALKHRIYDANLCKEILLPMLPEPKYKFSRANWYVAEFDVRDYDEVREWCTEQFGPQPTVADAWTRWYHNYCDRIFFRDEKDCAFFLLKWS